MARNSRIMSGLTPHQVFRALSDGESYDRWVVGTRMIRAAEPGWPAPGSAIHYTIGYGPLRKDDKTVCRSLDPDRHIELEAYAWPAGTARIAISAETVADGCEVTIEEHPLRGVVRKLHNPLMDLAIKLRNVETLRRLEKHTKNMVRAG